MPDFFRKRMLVYVKWSLLTSAYLADPERGYVLVSLVSKRGSSYLHPGARMLVRDDGVFWGSVSAGCLETRISEIAIECLRSGSNRMLSIDTRPHYGCFGEITLLFEVMMDRPAAESLFRSIAESLERREVLNLVTPDTEPEPPRGLVTRIGEEKGGLNERILPVPRLYIFGDWPDGAALAEAASLMNWQVETHDAADPRFDIREIVAAVEPDPWTAMMVMTHNLARDCVCLKSILPRSYPYVGVIGSRKRRDALIEELTNLDSPDLLEFLDGFHCPAGLNLGDKGPESIALSVLAEIQAVFHGKDGAPLHKLAQPVQKTKPSPW